VGGYIHKRPRRLMNSETMPSSRRDAASLGKSIPAGQALARMGEPSCCSNDGLQVLQPTRRLQASVLMDALALPPLSPPPPTSQMGSARIVAD